MFDRYTTAGIMVIITVAGLGAWPGSYIVSAETSSLRLRGKAQGIGGSVAAVAALVFGIALPYAYNPDEGNLASKVGFVFTGITGITTLVAWLYIPEMKGRTTAEIDRMFAIRLQAREFKSWQSEDIVGDKIGA